MATKQVATTQALGRPLAKEGMIALSRVMRMLVHAGLLTPQVESDLSKLASVCGAYAGVYDAMKWPDTQPKGE